MKSTWVALLFFLVSSALAFSLERVEKKLKLDPATMRFYYEDFDGMFNYPCKAEYANQVSPYDFNVKCFNQSELIRQFDVHLAITRYIKTTAPKTKIEVLYWVNHEGATSWLTFQDETTMHEFESSQSIVGEAAGLRLRVPLGIE